jgi:hypothetical protein
MGLDVTELEDEEIRTIWPGVRAQQIGRLSGGRCAWPWASSTATMPRSTTMPM